MANNENINNDGWEENLPSSNKGNSGKDNFDDKLESLLGETEDNIDDGHLRREIEGESSSKEDLESILDGQVDPHNDIDENPDEDHNPLLDGYLPDKNEKLDDDPTHDSLMDKNPLEGLGEGVTGDRGNQDDADDDLDGEDKPKNNKSAVLPDQQPEKKPRGNQSKNNPDKNNRNKDDKKPGEKGGNPLAGLGSGAIGAGALADAANKNPKSNKGKGGIPANDGKVNPASNNQKAKDNPLKGLGAGATGDNGHAKSSEKLNDDEDKGETNKPPIPPKKKKNSPASPKSMIRRNPVISVIGGAGGILSLFGIMIMIMMMSSVVGSGAGSKGYSIAGDEECAGTGKESQGTDGEAGVPDGKKSNPEKMPPGILTSPFGIRDGVPHKGQDIATGETGQKVPIYAWYEGTVVQSGAASGFGNWIVIEHDDNGKKLSTVYGHMKAEDLLVKQGDTVKSGQKISYQGSEGQSSGPHVHFEVHTGAWSPNNAVDPTPYLKDAVNPGEGDSGGDNKDNKDSKDKPSEDAKASGNEVTVKPVADSKSSREAKRNDSANTETVGESTISGVKQLKKDAYKTARSVLDQFPEVKQIGGWRPDPDYPQEHPSGRAIDIMIPDYETSSGKKLGDDIHRYLWKHKDEFGIKYVLFRQHEYDDGPDNGSLMEDRGDPNQNHFNHLHVATKSDEPQDGYDGSPGADRSSSHSASCCAKTVTNPSSNFTDSGNKVDHNKTVEEMIKRIIAVGKELKMDDKAIEIALITAEDESGFLNYANDGSGTGQAGASPVSPQEVAESLNYPHDAVGRDGNSVGPFQQQVGYWGDVPDLMRPGFQAGQFYAALSNIDYKSMAPEVAATTVQGNRDGAVVYAKFVESGKQNYAKYKDDAKASEQDLKDGKRGFENRQKVTGHDKGAASGTGDTSAGSDQSSSDSSNAECSAGGTYSGSDSSSTESSSSESSSASESSDKKKDGDKEKGDKPSEGESPTTTKEDKKE